MRALLLPLALVACQGGSSEEAAATPDRADAVEPLELPDTSGVDFVAAYTEALTLALSVNATAPWAGHVEGLALRQDGCPDLWAGAPEETDVDGEDGVSWSDTCETAGGLQYDGFVYWETSISTVGLPDEPAGRTEDATRTLEADGLVATPDGALFELDGTATDSITWRDIGGETSWTYSSLLDGTVTGSAAFGDGALAPGGWRTDLYLYLEGPVAPTFEGRGNIYLFDDRVAGRFDSLAMDLYMPGPGAAGPEDCALEPLGWIGLRDEDAYWYDLVFLPRTEDDAVTEGYANDPLSQCDGCGTLYVRGVESGEVCPDLSFLFDGAFEPPELAEYVLTLHDLP